MKIKTPSVLRLGWVLGVALGIAGEVAALPVTGRAAGTTLSETVTANGHRTRTFNWGISKTVDTSTINQFQGDSSTVTYKVTLTKDAGTVRGSIDGQVCITNGGSASTQNLQSKIEVTQPPSTSVIASTPLDVSANPVLVAGQTYCYSYSVDIPSGSVNGGTYKITARTTITNHSGHVGTPFGPNASQTTSIPSTETLVHNSVSVNDDKQGSLGTFSQSDSTSYTHSFTCDNQGAYTNKASITYDDGGSGPSSSATVTVTCYSLGVSKTVATSLSRTYTWNIQKSADQSSLTLVTGQTATVNYVIKVGTTKADSNWAATGQITVNNPAPIDATVNSIADAVGSIVANVNCPGTAPYTVKAGQSLVCTYQVSLPDGSGGTNTATATLQNHANGAPSGTTDFKGTAPVDFSSAQITSVDGTASLSDTYTNSGLPATVNAEDTPLTFNYARVVGPYSSAGTYSVDNTVTVKGTDTGKGGTSSVSIPVTVTAPSSGGCTRTIGYWKTHPSAVTPLLPIWLGTPNGAKSVDVTTSSQAVTIEGIPDASNGIDKLYAQLLSAKLSIKAGADSSAVSSTISAADSFLATHNDGDWSGLSSSDQAQVLAWASTLDDYNNGITGPGHCS